ncbi:MAG: superoxide dismutase family protein [Lachnospiraceae bacterium]
MQQNYRSDKAIGEILRYDRPDAVANIRSSSQYPNLTGLVEFYELMDGVLVVTSLYGLPDDAEEVCEQPILGMHIHEGNQCSGNETDPFANAGLHYNPDNCPHPYHSGDLPPVFVNHGNAWGAVVTDRFSVSEVVNRTVVIHARADDFMSQPAGNSGAKIGCGVIRMMSPSVFQ